MSIGIKTTGDARSIIKSAKDLGNTVLGGLYYDADGFMYTIGMDTEDKVVAIYVGGPSYIDLGMVPTYPMHRAPRGVQVVFTQDA